MRMDALPPQVGRYNRLGQGTVDIYMWRGLVCARAWPHKPRHPRAPKVAEQAARWKQSIADIKTVSARIQDAAKETARGSEYTWRDVLMKAAYNTLVTWCLGEL